MLRQQLLSEIRLHEARARAGDRRSEDLGLLPENDRLVSLRQRLAQVERLIDAIEETGHAEDGWPAHLGDPRDPVRDRPRKPA
jgi:hypothetical protein